MSDFKKGQQVIHCRDGLSVIVDETVIADNGYFVVKSTRGGGENIYVPIAKADSIIRPLMSEEEAYELIDYIKSLEVEFNPNTKQRRDALKRRLSSGDVHEIAHLYKQYYLFKYKNDGSIRFGPVDLDMLATATNNLLDELAISFNKQRADMEEFMVEQLAK